MTANVLEHRRAKAFADAVEDRPGTAAAQQFPELLTMVDALGSLPEPSLAPEVQTVQRAQLVAEFERAFAAGGGGVPVQRERGSHRASPASGRFRPSTRWGRKLAVSGLAAGVVVSAFGGVAAASSSAIPGDALYGVKRGLENWQLDFAGSDAQRGRLLLGEAAQRMSEARKLLAQQPDEHRLSPHVAAEVTKALSDMNAEGTQGRDLLQAIYQQNHSLAPMRSLASFDSAQQRQLDAIAPHLPSQADPMAGRLQQLLSGISAELAPLHLAPAATGGDSALPGAAASPSASTVSGSGSSAVGTGRNGTQPQGATTSGTGTMGSAAPGTSPSAAPGPLGGLGGLLGGSGGDDGSSPSTTPSAGSKPAPTPAASTPAGEGLTVPPLIPGLLPTIGIGLSGGDG